ALLTTASLGACGSRGQGISQAARDDLNPLISQARTRAAAHDAAGAAQALNALQQKAKQLERSDDVSPADAAAITHAVSEVESELAPAPTPPTTPLAPAPPFPPVPPDDHGDRGPGHGHKRGHHKNDDNGE